ncbi:MAG: hypothetical protein AABX29_08050 [Nanoarchaeota archaeon]
MKPNKSNAEEFAWFNAYTSKLLEIEIGFYDRLCDSLGKVVSSVFGRLWQEFPGEYKRYNDKYLIMSLNKLEEKASDLEVVPVSR